jgi:hypothetical protein
VVAVMAGLAVTVAASGCTPAQLADRTGAHLLAEVRPGARVSIRSRPGDHGGGRLVSRVGSSTEFGGDQVFWVVERRGGWLGVTTSETGDNRLGWIHYNPLLLRLYLTRWSLEASLARRELVVRYGKRVLRRFPVTIGRAGSSTPTGTFSVTDALAGKGLGPYYGCCVLATTGHQHNLPPGWIGGDRIGIHGTPGPVGGVASAGCLRARNADMVYLFAKVPIGTPVTISD